MDDALKNSAIGFIQVVLDNWLDSMQTNGTPSYGYSEPMGDQSSEGLHLLPIYETVQSPYDM